MKNYIILSAALLLLNIPVVAQRILDSPTQFRDFNEPVVSNLDMYPITHNNRTSDIQWIVYSDRNGNVTYTSAQGQEHFKTAGFLEKFYVIGEEGEYVNIYKDDGVDPIDLELSASAQDYGWIKKENLILYLNCLKNDKKVHQKGMLINTEETIKRASQRTNEKSMLVGFFKDPGFVEQTDFESNLYQIFHIYKKQGNAVLLGRGRQIRGDIEQTIMGWAPFDRITPWTHRIAFEPNWEEAAWKERKKANVNATIFFSSTVSNAFTANPNDRGTALWDSDPVKKMKGNGYQREIGQWRRFPVLREVNHNCFEVGTVGDIKTKYETVSSSEDARVKAGIETGIQKLKQKNILFVIDGSQSMQPYFKSMSNAVARSMEKISGNNNSSSSPKFGCVVYRDNAYRLMEKEDFNEDYNVIINFLNNIKAGDQNDPDHAEAVNYGLDEALRMLPEGETNFLVLVGDAGNHNRQDRSYVSKERIQQMVSLKQPHFLAFQVSNRSNEGFQAFSKFADDAADILSQSAATIRRNFKIPVEFPGEAQLTTASENDNFEYSKLVNSPIVGNLLACKPGEKVAPEKLEEEIIKLVDFSEELVNEVGTEVTSVGSGKKLVLDLSNDGNNEYEQYVDNYNGILLNFFNNLNLTPEQANYISQTRFQYYQPGFAAYKVNGLKHPLFKPVVLMNRQELGTLNNLFSELAKAVTGSSSAERREKFRETWLRLLSNHLGESNIERLATMTLEEIGGILYGTGGLPLGSNLLMNKNIDCVIDPACTSEREFNALVSSLYNNSVELQTILNNDNDPRKFQSAGFIYYWLDFDILP